jgi:hypothetical protein
VGLSWAISLITVSMHSCSCAPVAERLSPLPSKLLNNEDNLYFLQLHLGGLNTLSLVITPRGFRLYPSSWGRLWCQGMFREMHARFASSGMHHAQMTQHMGLIYSSMHSKAHHACRVSAT